MTERTGEGRLGSPRAKSAILAGLLLAMTLAAYWPALDAGFVWDDDDYVTSNAALRSVAGLERIWLDFEATPQYYPMVHTTFWVEYQLWRLHPAGYHLVNVLLHALGAVLAWRVLARLDLPGAWLAAALFALHPVHVESVAWITERKNVLSGVFYLASLLAYLRSAGVGEERSGGSLGWYAASLLAFAAALLSKTVTGSLPAVILLLVWWRRGRLGWGDVRPVLPFVVLAAGFGLLTIQLEAHLVGAKGRAWDLGFVERCLIAGRALWFYAGKLAWPDPLIFNYPRWRIDPGDWRAALWPLAAVATVFALFFARQRIGRGPLVAVCVFAGTLVPALGFFDVFPMRYSFVADHFQYLASLALLALFAAVATCAAGRGAAGRWAIAAAAAALVLAVLAGLTWRQAHSYRSLETLWRDTLAKNPDSWLAHDNLGILVEQRGELDEAIGHYREALRIEPEHHEGYNNLGGALRKRGEPEQAIALLQRSLEIEPDYIPAHNNLGLAYQDRGEAERAIRSFERALAIDPRSAAAHSNLGVVLAGQGRLEEAERHHRAALLVDPDLPAAHTNLASVLIQQGDLEQARVHLARALELQPDSDSARRNLRAVEKQLARGKATRGASELQGRE